MACAAARTSGRIGLPARSTSLSHQSGASRLLILHPTYLRHDSVAEAEQTGLEAHALQSLAERAISRGLDIATASKKYTMACVYGLDVVVLYTFLTVQWKEGIHP